MSRLSDLNELTQADFEPAETWLLAEKGTESQKVKAATLLASETEARASADTALSEAIEAEASARAQAVSTEVTNRNAAITSAINELDAASAGGSGKYIESISETNGIISTVAKSFGSVAKGGAVPASGGTVWAFLQTAFDHNIPRWVNGVLGKDITSYYNDGTLWKRLTGSDGYALYEDIYVGDFFKMSRAITCPDSYQSTTGSDYVTIAGIGTLKGNGDNISMDYNHLVMVPGKGELGTQHFGRHAMNATNTTTGGYKSSVMRTSVLGAVVSTGSTASGATINQQLYAEFGSHLKTTRELISNVVNANGYNRFGTASGCSSGWEWSSEQAILMSEIEAYGSVVWSSSGYDTGTAKVQLPLFRYSTRALNNRSAWYWLKDVASAAYFCSVDNYGSALYGSASNASLYVRPRFVLAA